MKTEVYSWRLEAELKRALEREARRRGEPVSAVLEEAARRWLADQRGGDEAEQASLHAALRDVVGTVRGGDPERSTHARDAVRERLRQRSGR